jgi:hypothetical protein
MSVLIDPRTSTPGGDDMRLALAKC